jgi:EAL domain-containing protein (putative c-di-GMP-specific phosphodiesterase class I)
MTQISIEKALANGWLDIWYQPKIDLKRKCLAGAEALTCMHHPQAVYCGLSSDSLMKTARRSLSSTH